MNNGIYISFFHGRHSPNEELSDWGFDGPIVGPVELQITYETWRISGNSWMDDVEIPFEDGCARIGDKYYGDISIGVKRPEPTDADFHRMMSFEQLKHEMDTTDYEQTAKDNAKA